MTRFLITTILCLLCVFAYGKVLRDIRFSNAETLPEGVQFACYGDKSSRAIPLAESRIGENRLHPWIIVNPGDRSWGFFICDVPVKDVPVGARLKLTAWTVTNNPGYCRVVISKNATFGGYCPDIACTTATKPSERHLVSVECARREGDDFVSLAVGLDYNSPNSWTVFDRIVLEELASDEESAVLGDNAGFDLLPLPMDVIQQTASETLKRMVQNAQTYVERLRDANQKDAADRVAGLLTAWDEILCGKRPVSEMAQIEQAIFNTCIICQMHPDMIAFNQQEILTPGYANAPLQACAAQNAQDNAILLVGNNFQEPASFLLKATGEAADAISFKRLQFISRMPDCPIPLLADDITELGGNSVAGFQVTFSAKSLPAGKYSGIIVMTPLDNHYPENVIPYEFTVIDWRMPDEMPIPTFTFDYGLAEDPASLQFLHQQRVNSFHIPVGNENVDLVKKILDNVEKAGLHKSSHFFVEVWFVRLNGGWKDEFNPWLKQLVEAFQAYGYDYDDWVLHIYDECLLDEFYDSAKAIHALYPDVKIYSDMMPADPEQAQKFATAIDYWCPHMAHWLEQRGASPVVKALYDSGLPIHLYNCDSNPTFPLKTYRLMPWIAWLDGCSGISFWTANPCEFRQTPGTQNFGMRYTVNGKPITSRRWDMWAAGFEDYLMLCEAAKKDPQATRKIAENVLAHYNSDDLPISICSGREELLKIINQ